MIIKAHAKLNLAIDLIGRRDDGYHEVDMISIPLELHDCLEIEELSPGNETYITADDVSLICDEYNTVNIAYRLLREKYPAINKPYRIQIYKSIPTQAGLAGGSADAAGLINNLIKTKRLNVEKEDLSKLALQIGADVPYSLTNIPSRVQGIGEILNPIKAQYSFFVLIVRPQQGLKTADVYQKSDEIKSDYHPDIAKLAEILTTNPTVEEIAPYLYNGLRPAAEALCPDIALILAKMKTLNLKACEMSGSGSSCFALTQSEKDLERAFKIFQKMGYEVIKTTAGFQHRGVCDFLKHLFHIK